MADAGARIRAKNSGRVPVICEPDAAHCVAGWATRRCKFLVSEKLTGGQFRRFVRNNLSAVDVDAASGQDAKTPKVKLFLQASGAPVDEALTLAELDALHRSDDGILYMRYRTRLGGAAALALGGQDQHVVEENDAQAPQQQHVLGLAEQEQRHREDDKQQPGDALGPRHDHDAEQEQVQEGSNDEEDKDEMLEQQQEEQQEKQHQQQQEEQQEQHQEQQQEQHQEQHLQLHQHQQLQHQQPRGLDYGSLPSDEEAQTRQRAQEQGEEDEDQQALREGAPRDEQLRADHAEADQHEQHPVRDDDEKQQWDNDAHQQQRDDEDEELPATAADADDMYTSPLLAPRKASFFSTRPPAAATAEPASPGIMQSMLLSDSGGAERAWPSLSRESTMDQPGNPPKSHVLAQMHQQQVRQQQQQAQQAQNQHRPAPADEDLAGDEDDWVDLDGSDAPQSHAEKPAAALARMGAALLRDGLQRLEGVNPDAIGAKAESLRRFVAASVAGARSSAAPGSAAGAARYTDVFQEDEDGGSDKDGDWTCVNFDGAGESFGAHFL